MCKVSSVGARVGRRRATRVEGVPRIAYLGPEGTFTEAALLQMVAGDMVPPGGAAGEVVPLPYDSAGGALEAIRTGDTDYACVPIENSIDGSVIPTLDGLADGSALQIYAEHTLDVAFTIVTCAPPRSTVPPLLKPMVSIA